MIITPQVPVEQRVCLTCGAVVAASLALIHETWHANISGVAIEQGAAITALRAWLATLSTGAQQ